jgi:hypothetical protein
MRYNYFSEAILALCPGAPGGRVEYLGGSITKFKVHTSSGVSGVIRAMSHRESFSTIPQTVLTIYRRRLYDGKAPSI